MNKSETIESIKDQILQATLDLILKGNAPILSFELIAEEAGITVEQIAAVFQDVDAISLALTQVSLKKHEEQAKELAEGQGIDALQKLLTHDLNFFYPLEMDRKQVASHQYTESFALFGAYMDHELPRIYTNFLNQNPNLLPSEETDVTYYGHFIAHSLLFFNKNQLSTFVKQDEERTLVTEQIIASLFGREEITLTNF